MDSLICNTLRCRKTLSFETVAVVTSCSHIFCVDCANALLGSPPSCHICRARLEDNYDLVQADLQPPDLWKSSILAGLPPPVIIDIASRALSFWTYQQDHEKMYQTMLANQADKRVAVLEKDLSEARRKNEGDNEYWRVQLNNVAKDLEVEKHKTQQLKEMNAVNAKAYAKLKTNNEQLKQQFLLGSNPINAANVYPEDAGPVSAPAIARQPFVPSSNSSARPYSSASQVQARQSRPPNNETFYAPNAAGSTTSTATFFSDPDRSRNFDNGGGAGARGSRGNSSSRERHYAGNAQPLSHAHRQAQSSRLTHQQPLYNQSVAMGVGDGRGVGHRGGLSNQAQTQTFDQGQYADPSRRHSSNSFPGHPQNLDTQLGQRGGTGERVRNTSAGNFRPAAFGRAGSN